MIDEIRDKIQSISPITDKAWMNLKPLFKSSLYKPFEKLLNIGESAKEVYFLHRGLVRSYALTNDGSEFSRSIFSEQSFFSPVTSLVTKRHSNLCYETLTTCHISKANYNDLEGLNALFHDLERFHRKQMEWLYIQNERSEIELATLSAADRYLVLQKRISNIDSLIPQYQIASHLGITPVQLSRIRRAFSKPI